MSRAPKSRFRSAAGKKIEKQVREHATIFGPYANNRRGHGVASEAKHHGKPMMASNFRQRRDILLNEKLASSTMHASKTNKRDNVATLSRTDNKRSVDVKENRQVNHTLRQRKQDPLRKNTDSKRVEAIMPNGNLTPLERSSKYLMRQPTTSSLKTPSFKNVTTRDEPIIVLGSLEVHDSLKPKTTMNMSKNIDNSQPPQFKAMEGLVHRTNNFDGFNGCNDALPSRLNRQVSLDSREGFIVDSHSNRKLTIEEVEEASPKRMKKQRSKEAKGHDTRDRNPMGEINGDAYPSGVRHYRERNLTCGLIKRQGGNTKTNEDEAIGSGDMELMEVEDGGTQLETHDCRSKNKKQIGIESNVVGDGKADDSFAKKNLEPLPKDHVSLDCSNEAIQPEKLTRRKLKKRRQYIMTNEDEELHVEGGDHSPLDAYGDGSRLTSQAPISIDCLAKVPAPFVSEHAKQQCNCCSKPIDKPIWSGIFKIDGHISLAGHLSTKSCEEVWKLSRSLMPVVEVAKLSRSKLKIWETSKPSCDSIGLYFFPNQMRHDKDLDKLVKEVIEDDLVLQTVVGEAEMLIFPSTLLPERYKTFQRKPYLWGVFRPRQDQCAIVAEPVHDTVCCTQEKEEEEQHASNQQDEVQEVHWKSPAQQAAATRGVPGSPDMDFQPVALEETQLGDALRHNLHSAEATAVAANPAAITTGAAAVAINSNAATTEAGALATNAATIPAEAAENGTNAATITGSHGQSDSIAVVSPGSLLYFVAGQITPKLEQLIREMQREGSLVVAIRGEAIGGGLWPGNIAPTNISRP